MKLLFQIVAGIGLVLMVAAGITYFQTVNFLSHAKLTTGSVVGIFTSVDQDTNSTLYCPEISFTTKAGQTVKFEANTCSSPSIYIVGDLVNLYYDPQNPQDAQIKGFGPQYLLATSMLVSGLPLAVIGLFGLFMLKRRERTRQDASV